MKRNLVIVYWLMLLVSTCAIGGVAFYLLQREDEHLRELAKEAVMRKGRFITEQIDVLVGDAKSGLIQGLAEFSDPGLEQQLAAWKDTNPYVRNVFVYRPGSVPGRGGTFTLPTRNNERSALARALWSGSGWIWGPEAVYSRQVIQVQQLPAAAQTVLNTEAVNTATAIALGQNSVRQNVTLPNSARNPRAEVRETAKLGVPGSTTTASSTLASAPPPASAAQLNVSNNFSFEANGLGPLSRQNNTAVPSLPAAPAANILATFSDGVLTISQGNMVFSNNGFALVESPLAGNSQSVQLMFSQTVTPARPEHGWVVAGSADESRWLGWLRPAPGGPVRGVEMDWEGLLKPMRANAFPSRVDATEGFVLRDSARKIVVSRFGDDDFAATALKALQGSGEATSGVAPIVDFSVGPDLPGWTLAVYYKPAANFSSGFMLVGTVMVATLLVSVLVGGTLLLREARREASEAARKTSFVSNVSHELKTPLTTIRMYAELLGDGRARAPEKQRSYLATIIGESQRLTRLVNNVLDFSRLDQGRKKYKPDTVPLSGVVESVAAAQRPRLADAGLEVEVSLPEDDSVHAHVDRDALEQVLLNLLDNAIKYASEGRWVGVRVSKDANNAILTVKDHGPGVPPEHRQKIFDVFHRVDDTLTGGQPGSGLGLSIARRLLRDQGGDLRYEPNAPTGATFTATMPLAVPIVQFDATAKAGA